MKKYRLLLPVVFMLVVSCGLNNTMYNARKYFKAAQERPLNANGRPNNQAVEEYTKCIKKCGIILSNPKTTGNTDEALFLMAQSLYYKGNSAFQAKDQFEALIKGFPQSPYFGEAHLLLARVFRDVNRKPDAQKLLEEFILNPAQKKLHPRALLTLAEFDIADKEYISAQYWLQRIINEYPKSNEYGEAFFLFGKNYYVQKDYTESQKEFSRMAEQRGIAQNMKLEARYFVAMNAYMLGDFESGWKGVQKLLKDEVRPDKLSQIRVLKARLLFARDEDSEGVAEVDAISKAYPRTLSSSDAQYYLGEYYFYKAGNLDLALAAYNRVKAEFPTTELMDVSQRKATAITQLKQKTNWNLESDYQDFVDYHISAAENYFGSFDLADSALVMYQRVIDSRDSLRVLRDSLEVQLWAKTSRQIAIEAELLDFSPADSLEAPKFDLGDGDSAPDTLKLENTDTKQSQLEPDSLTQADSLTVTELTKDATDAPADSMKVEDLPPEEKPEEIADKVVTDELKPEEPATEELKTAEQDPEELARQEAILALEREKTTLLAELTALEKRLSDLNALLLRIDKEVLPLALFSQASLLNKTQSDAERLQELAVRMSEEYNTSKYNFALSAMLLGAPVRLIDPREQEEELNFDTALGYAEAAPDSLVAVLDELTRSEYSTSRLRANFRLGWFYTFEQADSTLAKTYLDEALKLERSGDYATLIGRFYNGTKFIYGQELYLPDSLSVTTPDSLANVADSTAVADSLMGEPTEPETTEPAPLPVFEGPSPEAPPDYMIPEQPGETPPETAPEEVKLPEDAPQPPPSEVEPAPEDAQPAPPPLPPSPEEPSE